MVEAGIMSRLCCPETRQPVRPADQKLLEELNRKVASGTLKNRAGVIVTKALEAGLVRADGKVVYPVCDGIPVMLSEEAVVVAEELKVEG